jgi:hypothetical protein
MRNANPKWQGQMRWLRSTGPEDSPWAGGLERRYVVEREVSAEASWRIGEWCVDSGATEFSMRVVDIVGVKQ